MNRNLSTIESDVNSFIDSLSTAPYDIDTRLRLLLTCLTSNKNDWKLLERATGLSAEKWRQFTRGTTKVSSSMLEVVGKTWPQYAFWLITGVSDEKHGHHAPHRIWAFPNLDPDDEYEPEGKYSNYEKTTTYFKSASKLVSDLWPLGAPRESFNSDFRGGGKWGKAKKTDKRLSADLDLLHKLAELKDREFLANNSQFENTQEE